MISLTSIELRRGVRICWPRLMIPTGNRSNLSKPECKIDFPAKEEEGNTTASEI
jgi:hypothetical protein